MYSGNFFAGLSAGGTMRDVGYTRENPSVITVGLATKAGYAWELGPRFEQKGIL